MRGRDLLSGIGKIERDVSIHAPVRGRDLLQGLVLEMNDAVSIHAPVRGRDALPATLRSTMRCFNPRARAWARHIVRFDLAAHEPFQSTRPCVGATDRIKHWAARCKVSIHAPVRGRDGLNIDTSP